MRRLGLLVVLLMVVILAPLRAQETTPEANPTPTQEIAAQVPAAPGSEATAEAHAPVPTAHIRFAHLSVDTPPVQIFINGELSAIQTIAYPDITGWVELPVGTYSIAAVPIDAALEAAVVGPLNLSFTRGTWVTIVLVGSLQSGTLRAQFVAETYGQLSLNQARLTIYHGIEGGPDVDVLANGDTIPVLGLGYTGAFMADVPAGASNIQFVVTGTQDVLLELGERPLEAGTFYFIGLTGTADAPQAVIAEVPSTLVASFLGEVKGTIIDTLEADGRFATLLAAIDAAGLTETLNGQGLFTVFAPVDAAFETFSAEQLSALLDDANVLRYHIVEGRHTSQDLFAAGTLTTLQGSDLTVSLNEQGGFLNGNVQIIILDIPATNGVIHAINAVLLPGAVTTGEPSVEVTAEATQGG